MAGVVVPAPDLHQHRRADVHAVDRRLVAGLDHSWMSYQILRLGLASGVPPSEFIADYGPNMFRDVGGHYFATSPAKSGRQQPESLLAHLRWSRHIRDSEIQ